MNHQYKHMNKSTLIIHTYLQTYFFFFFYWRLPQFFRSLTLRPSCTMQNMPKINISIHGFAGACIPRLFSAIFTGLWNFLPPQTAIRERRKGNLFIEKNIFSNSTKPQCSMNYRCSSISQGRLGDHKNIP